MSRGTALAAALLAGACAADPDLCAFGNDRSGGPACALPTLTADIDGDAAEWDASDLLLHRACHDCPVGDVDHFQVAREGEAAVVLRVVTRGPPVSDGSGTYLVRFLPVQDPDADLGLKSYGLELLLLGDVVIGRMKPWYEVTGLPVDMAWTADGFELRAPAAILPFEGGALFSAGLADGTSGGSLARVCWLPGAAADACAFYFP